MKTEVAANSKNKEDCNLITAILMGGSIFTTSKCLSPKKHNKTQRMAPVRFATTSLKQFDV